MTGIITGAASGIGRAIATKLAERMNLVLVDATRPDDVAGKLRGIGNCQVRCVAGDVRDETVREAAFEQARQLGGLRALVPCAGITRDRLAIKGGLYPEADWDLVMSVNLKAPAYWAMRFIQEIGAMRGGKPWESAEGEQGVVVFIGSVSSQGNKGQVSYAASKAGLEAVAATLQKEGMFMGVRSTIVHPGYTATPMVEAMPEKAKTLMCSMHQIKRLIRPEEIANVVSTVIDNPILVRPVWADGGFHPFP